MARMEIIRALSEDGDGLKQPSWKADQPRVRVGDVAAAMIFTGLSSVYGAEYSVNSLHYHLSMAEQKQAKWRCKIRPVFAAIGERRKGVAQPEFSDCGVGNFACVLAGLFGSALSEAIAIAVHSKNADVVGDTIQ